MKNLVSQHGIYIMAFLLTIFLVVKFHLNRLKKSNASLQMINRQRQEELKSINLKLEKANKELKDFAYVVSHDLKAPLRGVSKLALFLYEDYKDKFDDEGKENLDLMQSRIKRMEDLIDGILQYSRAGTQMGYLERINLNRLITEINENLAPPKGITVKIDRHLPRIIFNRARIQQVFQNLMSNAIKYMDKPEGEIEITYINHDDHWVFVVKDTGPGIDEKYHEQIFKMFKTLHSIDEKNSTGVGLTVVKRIVEKYGGNIWLDSNPGEGTTFYFSLPKIGEDKMNSND
jgi:light-regulated signal transduction histidine kinase (bacteriophytochrome)